MSNRLKNHIYYVFAYIFSLVISTIAGNFVLISVCNAIMKDEAAGLRLTRVLMWILTLLLAFIMIYRHKYIDSDEQRAYVASMKNQTYHLKNELRKALCNKDFWGEVILIAVVTIVYWLINFGYPAILINIPLFGVFDIGATLYLHYLWLRGK